MQKHWVVILSFYLKNSTKIAFLHTTGNKRLKSAKPNLYEQSVAILTSNYSSFNGKDYSLSFNAKIYLQDNFINIEATQINSSFLFLIRKKSILIPTKMLSVQKTNVRLLSYITSTLENKLQKEKI